MNLSDAIAELPDTADGIAAYFIEQDVRGECGDPHLCPVAEYLTETCYFAEAVVAPTSIGVHLAYPAASGQNSDEIATPRHVKEFIVRFDAGEWPELRTATA